MVSTELVIDDLLAGLGYRGEAARSAARAALEAAGLTTARKQRIAALKLAAVEAELTRRFLLVCSRSACREPGPSGRVFLDAQRPTDCMVCAGSANGSAIDRTIQSVTALGIRRVVVIGGSPGTREALRARVGDRLELRLVSGTERRTRREARADLAWADAVVVWGATELDHAVSKHYTDGGARRIATCPRRGIEALMQTLFQLAAHA